MLNCRNFLKINIAARNFHIHPTLKCRYITTDGNIGTFWEDELSVPLNPSIDELHKCSTYHEYLTQRVRKYMKLTVEDLDKKSFFLVELLQETLAAIHSSTGLPWWIVISGFTVTLKLAMLPLWASAERNRRKNAAAMPILADLQNRLFESKRKKDYQEMLKLQRELFLIISERKIIKSAFIQGTLSFFQFATFYWVYATQRSLCRNTERTPDFILEAPLWLDSIALPDPYYIFPTFAAALLLTIYNNNLATKNAIKHEQTLKIHKNNKSTGNKKEKAIQIIGKFAIYSFILVSYSMPAGAFLYLAPSFAFHALLRLATKNDSFCRFFQLGKVVN